MTNEPSDDDLDRRQSAMRSDAATLLADLEGSGAFAGLGRLLPTGSFVSGLMSWREVDVMAAVGGHFSPRDVLGLLQRVVGIPGVVGLLYTDERGIRSPTGERRDERYHVTVTVARSDDTWQVDLSLWLHDDHANVTRWHEDLRNSLTGSQRRAVLRIKDSWHRRPEYPDQVSGLEIYTAVLDSGVRGPEEFAAWLAARGLPAS